MIQTIYKFGAHKLHVQNNNQCFRNVSPNF